MIPNFSDSDNISNNDNNAISSNKEKTEVAYGNENTMKIIIERFSIVNYKADICADFKGPIIFVETPILQAHNDMKNRGVMIRFITDIKKNNITYCKILSKIGEVRHLGGVNGNILPQLHKSTIRLFQ